MYINLQKKKKYIENKNGNLSKHPGAPTWPESMLTTIHFNSEDDQSTRVTIQTEAYGNFTTDELSAFAAERSGMTKGWTGSLDKLEEQLTK